MVVVRRVKGGGPLLGLLVVLGIVFVASWSHPQPASLAETADQKVESQPQGWGGSDPQYLIFWGQPKDVPDLLARIGTTGDGKSTQLGFGLPLRTFEQEEKLPTAIHDAFQTAKKYNLAVTLSFDDHLFWQNRSDLWNWFDPAQPGFNPANKNNVEWIDWKGTPNKARYLNWGSPQKLAPCMCFSSPVLRKEITRIVTKVIGPALKSELGALKEEGKENLFA